ncbi:MAG TPA: KH domain-containing protein [Acidimicrobiales bacterium]|nr:KH domain-containing protein [Acidimicrobiales bacterium]
MSPAAADGGADEAGEEYEAGDVNVADSAGPANDLYGDGDVNTVDTVDDDYDDEDDDDEPGAPIGNEATGNEATGGTPVEVLTYLAESLANEPDAVVIQTEDRRGSTVLRLHVAPEDMGRVIGRRGRTAQAIRTLVGVAGARDGVQTTVDIVDA